MCWKVCVRVEKQSARRDSSVNCKYRRYFIPSKSEVSKLIKAKLHVMRRFCLNFFCSCRPRGEGKLPNKSGGKDRGKF